MGPFVLLKKIFKFTRLLEFEELNIMLEWLKYIVYIVYNKYIIVLWYIVFNLDKNSARDL